MKEKYNISNPLVWVAVNEYLSKKNNPEKGYELANLLFAGLSNYRNAISFVEKAIQLSGTKDEMPKWFVEAQTDPMKRKEFDFEIKAWGNCEDLNVKDDINQIWFWIFQPFNIIFNI